jgi:hypothetical protein
MSWRFARGPQVQLRYFVGPSMFGTGVHNRLNQAMVIVVS